MTIEELLAGLLALEPAIMKAIAPELEVAVTDALQTVKAALSAKALPVAETVKDVDDAAEAALKAKFPNE